MKGRENMPKYMLIAYYKHDIKSSIFTLFTSSDEQKGLHIDYLMNLGFRVTVYEWYAPEDDNEMPYYKILCECFQLGY